MRMSVCRVYVLSSLIVAGSRGRAVDRLCAVSSLRRPPTTAVGEDYHIEAAYSWWDAEPSLIVNSESLGILGTDIDLITDLGIEKKRLGMFDLVLRPAKKHRFRFQRLPIKYEVDAFPVHARIRLQRPALPRRPAGDDDRWTSRPIASATSTTSCISRAASSACWST